MAVAWRRGAFKAGLVGATTLALVFADARPARAQIWVVTDADGSHRFTTSPEPGAVVFMRTIHGARTGRMMTVGIPAPRYRDEIACASERTGLAPALITAVIAAESNFNPNARSSKGAQGLMQLMPATAASLGVRNVWDPRQNIRAGSDFLARLYAKYDDLSLALAAYKAGEGTVARHGGVPPFRETRNYVRRVLSYYERYRGGAP